MSLLNYLGFVRMILVPILVVILLTRVSDHELLSIVIFWVAAQNDLLDGDLARKLKQITTLGKLQAFGKN